MENLSGIDLCCVAFHYVKQHLNSLTRTMAQLIYTNELLTFCIISCWFSIWQNSVRCKLPKNWRQVVARHVTATRDN
jgi:hypothetical protein